MRIVDLWRSFPALIAHFWQYTTVDMPPPPSMKEIREYRKKCAELQNYNFVPEATAGIVEEK